MPDRTYTNGPFTITEKQITDDAGTWLHLELILSSGPVRLLVPGPMDRQRILKTAERAALRMLGDSVSEALTEHEEDTE